MSLIYDTRSERSELAEFAKGTKHHSRKDPISAMRKIVETRSAGRVGGVLVDLFTASIIVQIHDALNEANRASLAKMPVRKMASVCYKLANRCSA